MSDNYGERLPTAEEYRKMVRATPLEWSEWSEPKYLCPDCGGNMCKNQTIRMLTHPETYMYRCDKCGRIDYQLM